MAKEQFFEPYYIDPETLVEKGWLSKKDLQKYDFGNNL